MIDPVSSFLESTDVFSLGKGIGCMRDCKSCDIAKSRRALETDEFDNVGEV